MTFFHGILIGCVATIGLDILTAVARRLFRFPATDWALVGRWFGHLPRGVFIHHGIANSPAIADELVIGWVAHYVTGALYGAAYLGIVQLLLSASPSLFSALAFGLVTVTAPWLILMPGMGFGAFASKAPRPGHARLVSALVHVTFGACLYMAWRLLG